MLMYSEARARELAHNLQEVQAQIAAASQDLSAVRAQTSALPELTVVTKFFPAEDVAALYDMGVRSVGENRDQEVSGKAAQLLPHAHTDDPLRWSFIGQLQTNKAKSVVKYAHEVQSVDRLSLAETLSKAYLNQLKRYEAGEGPAPASLASGGLKCLIQVGLNPLAPSTAGQASLGARGGASPEDTLELAHQISRLPGLVLGGVMAVAPLDQSADAAFERLYRTAEKLWGDFPEARTISAGMSTDLEAAIRWGSTNVRVGSHIMGKRPML